MKNSIIALQTAAEPLEFIGRYVLESGDDLRDTLLIEYQKRFNDPEKFALYLLKYHWYRLTGAPFTNYMIGLNVLAGKAPKKPVVVYIGDMARNRILGKDIAYVDETLLDERMIDQLFLINIKEKSLSVFKFENSHWIKTEEHSLAVDDVSHDTEAKSAVEPSHKIQAEDLEDMADQDTLLQE